VKLTRTGFGKIHGDIDLKGRGDNVAQMLGTSSGSVAMLMGSGEISNLLLEFAGLDGGEVFKFLMSGDRTVPLRCGAVAFDVNQGLMNARALVLDTADTVVYGEGQISLANEAMDLTLRPYPKDVSILSLRTPLKVSGSLAHPRFGPEKVTLAGRLGVILGLGAINPLLGLAATAEPGPGKDANCGPALREAYSPSQAARIAAMSKPPAAEKSGRMGGPPAPGSSAAPGTANTEGLPASRREPPAPNAPMGKGEPYGP
jgi:AsmA family protein